MSACIFVFQTPAAEMLFALLCWFFTKRMERHQKHALLVFKCLVANLFNLARDRDGDGVGGPFGNIFRPCREHFGSILGSPMPPQICFSTRITFLEMAHTNFISPFWIPSKRILICIENTLNIIFKTKTTLFIYIHMYISILWILNNIFPNSWFLKHVWKQQYYLLYNSSYMFLNGAP